MDRNCTITNKGNLAKGTCQWINGVNEFHSWFKDPARVLWISGGPGKGKTFLSIYLVGNLPSIATKMVSKDSPTLLVLEYFCDHSDSKRNTARAVLRGLLYQLLETHETLYKYILPKFELWQAREESPFRDIDVEELWTIFEQIISDKVLGQIYFVLDGLDKCDSLSIAFLVSKLGAIYSVNNPKESRKVKTVIVSRPLTNDVQNTIQIDLDLEYSEKTQADIKAFISSSIANLFPKLLNNDAWPQSLEDTLLKRAEGTFL